MNTVKKTVLLFFCSLIFSYAAYASSSIIKKGDYISFGNYNGTDIVWIALYEEDGGITLLSRNVLFEAPFGESGRWAQSGLRESIYAEGGFLKTAFTDEEYGLLIPKSIKSALNDNNTALSQTGTQVQQYFFKASNVLKNNADAFCEYTEDRVFVPSLSDIDNLSGNAYLYGADAVTAEDMQHTVRAYWLRDAMYGADSTNVRYVTENEEIGYIKSENTAFVRVMCVIDAKKLGVESGSGEEETPYVVKNELYISVKPEAETVTGAGSVNISVFTNADDGENVSVYANGSVCAKNADGTYSALCDAGVNIITAEITDSDGRILKEAQPASVFVIENEEKKIAEKVDFEGEIPQKYTDRGTVIQSGAARGNIFKLVSQAKSNNQVHIGTFSEKKDLALIEADIKFETPEVSVKSPFYIRLLPANVLFAPIVIDKNGLLTLQGIENTAESIQLEKNRWYNFKIIIKDADNTITVAVDNKVICRNKKIVQEFKYTRYVNLSSNWNASDSDNVMYADNIYLAEVSEKEAPVKALLSKTESGYKYFVMNNSKNTLNANLYIAGYENEGKMTAALKVPVLAEGETGIYAAVGKEKFGGEYAFLKTFLFTENLTPAAPCRVLNSRNNQ